MVTPSDQLTDFVFMIYVGIKGLRNNTNHAASGAQVRGKTDSKNARTYLKAAYTMVANDKLLSSMTVRNTEKDDLYLVLMTYCQLVNKLVDDNSTKAKHTIRIMNK